jgi:hypothetical protein
MITCILCLKDKPAGEFNKEHVFPEAIGGSLILRDALCTSCNSWLGHRVDAELTNNGLVQLARLALGIEGKSGAVPNPFLNGTVADDPTRKLQYRLDKEGTPRQLYLVPSVNVTKSEDAITVNLSLDASDKGKIPDILETIAKRNGLQVPKEQIDQLLNAPVQTQSPWMRVQLSMHASSWKKALLKIAYELAYHWLGSEYLKDPGAERLRGILKSEDHYEDGNGGLDAIVTLCGPQKLIPFWSENKGTHLALLTRGETGLLCYVRLFQSIEALVPISESGFGRTELDLPMIFVDAKKATHKELPFIEAVNQLVQGRQSGI